MLILLGIIILIIAKHLPVTADLVCGNPNEAFPVLSPNHHGVEYGCPAPFKIDPNPKPKLSELDNCIFQDMFLQNNDTVEKLCQSEVKPVIFQAKNTNNEMIPCGGKKSRFLYSFGFFYCPITNTAQNEFNPTVNLEPIVMYNICYDTAESRTIWTRHRIMTPSLFHKSVIEEKDWCMREISTEAFVIDSNNFLEMKNAYELKKRKRTSTKIRMVPQPMVPAEHFATAVWKKTTNHFINTAPLWTKLVPLMKLIDNTIKNAIIKEMFGPFATINQGLFIYTRTKASSTIKVDLPKLIKKEFSIEPNIWYKFIYSVVNQSGIMIYIRNTPQNPFKKEQGTFSCNFNKWIEYLNFQDIEPTDLQYAYCDKPTNEEVLKIFHIKVVVRSFLDIDRMLM